MADDSEHEPSLQSSGELQPLRRDISRRSVVVGLIGLVAAEAVAGGVTWQALSQGVHKIALTFAPPVSTPTSLPLGATLYIYRGHANGVNAVGWSPDGKRIVSGSDDRTVQVWDAIAGGHVLIYRGHSDVVFAVAWSPNGKRIASGGGPSISPILIVSAANVRSTDAHICSFDSGSGVWRCRVVLTEDASSQGILSWSAKTDLGGVSFSPASGTLSPGGSVQVTITIPASNCTEGTFNFEAQGGNMVPVSWTCTPPTQPPPPPTPTPPSPPPPPQCPEGSVGAPPNCHVVCPSGFVRQGDECVPEPPEPPDTTVQVWDAITHGVSKYLGHKAGVTAVAWSPDGTRIASASFDKTVQVWDAMTGETILTYRGHKDRVTAVAWSPTRIASASFDKTVQVWDAAIGSDVFVYKGHTAAVLAVAWSPDGKHIASGSADTTVQVWDASTGAHLLTYQSHTAAVLAVAWSPDGKHIASGSADTAVQVWDVTSGGHVFTYVRHLGVVTTVAWSPDGMHIASGSRDTTVQVWKAI